MNLLAKLEYNVAICEEAGEVLEAHTLCFLKSNLQHLILIGDHLQLRPHISSYDLSAENKGGVSICMFVCL